MKQYQKGKDLQNINIEYINNIKQKNILPVRSNPKMDVKHTSTTGLNLYCNTEMKLY